MSISEEIYKEIEGLVKRHHLIYRFPVKGELWEDIFDQSINKELSEWQGGGHEIGYDVTDIKTGLRFQNKSGAINLKNETLHWSGHRMTRYNTINEKVKFISSDHCDYYAMLARDKKDWDCGSKKYYIFIFNSNIIDYSKLEWCENYNKNGKLSGWIGKSNLTEYSASISIPMSHQLWTTASMNVLPTPYIIEIQ